MANHRLPNPTCQQSKPSSVSFEMVKQCQTVSNICKTGPNSVRKSVSRDTPGEMQLQSTVGFMVSPKASLSPKGVLHRVSQVLPVSDGCCPKCFPCPSHTQEYFPCPSQVLHTTCTTTPWWRRRWCQWWRFRRVDAVTRTSSSLSSDLRPAKSNSHCNMPAGPTFSTFFLQKGFQIVDLDDASLSAPSRFAWTWPGTNSQREAGAIPMQHEIQKPKRSKDRVRFAGGHKLVGGVDL